MSRLALTLLMATLSGACLDAPRVLTRGQFEDAKGADGADGATTTTDAQTTEVDDVADDSATADDADVTPGDSGDVLDVADVADVAETTTATDTVTETVEPGDCSTEEELLDDECLDSVVPLVIFEPQRETSGMGPPIALTRSQRENGASSWARAAEPVSVALRSGLASDPALIGHFPFEGTAHAQSPSTLQLTEGPQPQFTTGQAGLGQAILVNPRFIGVTASVSGKPLTMMGWAQIAPAVLTTASYDLIGFQTGSGLATPAIALGVRAGRWTASFNSQSTDFGAVVAGWQHVALTWDPNDQRLVLYLDGRVAAVQTPASVTVANDRFFVGVGGMPPTNAPLLDDVVALTRALQLDEVRAHAQMRRPFGAELVAGAQPDFRDLRVVSDGESIVPHDVIGRRPHGINGAEVEDVWGVWSLGSSVTMSYAEAGMGTLAFPATTAPATGVFGDAGGALDLASGGRSDVSANRSARWGTALGVEIWAKVEVSEAGVACTTNLDGTTLVTTEMKDGVELDGWSLKVCDGKLVFQTETSSVTSTTVIADGQWHHLLATYDATALRLVIDGVADGMFVITGAPTDGGGNVTVLQRPPGAGSGGQAYLGAAVVDDLVLHKVARTAGYAFDRARPRLPHVRFLVATGASVGGEHPIGSWELRAGNAQVLATRSNPCGSLISSCTDYVGWWRFDDPGESVLDNAAGARDLIIEGEPTWVPGIDGGFALDLDGVDDYAVRFDAVFGIATWGIDLAARPDAVDVDQVMVERPGDITAQPPKLNYALRPLNNGALLHVFGAPPGATAGEAVVPGPMLAATWNTAAGGFDGDILRATLNGVGGQTTTTLSPSLDQGTGPLWVGRTGRDSDIDAFGGALDALRIIGRAMSPEEQLKYPPLSWRPE